jgi:hypothetical protein
MILIKDLLEKDVREIKRITDVKPRKLNILIKEARGIYKLK